MVLTGGGGADDGIGSMYFSASVTISSSVTSPVTTIVALDGEYPVLKCCVRSSSVQDSMSDIQPTTGHWYGCAV